MGGTVLGMFSLHDPALSFSSPSPSDSLSLAIVLVAVMKSKELKTQTDHAHSLILSFWFKGNEDLQTCSHADSLRDSLSFKLRHSLVIFLNDHNMIAKDHSLPEPHWWVFYAFLWTLTCFYFYTSRSLLPNTLYHLYLLLWSNQRNSRQRFLLLILWFSLLPSKGLARFTALHQWPCRLLKQYFPLRTNHFACSPCALSFSVTIMAGHLFISKPSFIMN